MADPAAARVDDETVKLVGHVVFESQRLEGALIYLSLFWDIANQRVVDQAAAEARVESKRAASQLLKDVASEGLIPSEVSDLCQRALNERNVVVHRLTRENRPAWSTPEGRAEVTRYVASVHALVVEATDKLAVPLTAIAQGLGLPTDGWDQRAARGLQ